VAVKYTKEDKDTPTEEEGGEDLTSWWCPPPRAHWLTTFIGIWVLTLKHTYYHEERTYPENPAIYDVTSLYYLNNLVGAMEAPSCSEAQKALDAFFNI
jgi:hypothetical protein